MKSLIKAAEWTLSTDTAQGAPQEPMYESECTTCAESSGATEGSRVHPEIWALKHTGSHPTHRQFRAVITSFWRVSPAEGNPLYDQEAGR
ncbi:hypothetical protein ACFO9E_18075 [Streptomyces maoxianensis]|uniref:DUF7848 domain-containing protein n=1 Tax=Streptomyces maoxianensis TaxID=1459942 RepID=A0ABV9G9V5_9ACTN